MISSCSQWILALASSSQAFWTLLASLSAVCGQFHWSCFAPRREIDEQKAAQAVWEVTFTSLFFTTHEQELDAALIERQKKKGVEPRPLL